MPQNKKVSHPQPDVRVVPLDPGDLVPGLELIDSNGRISEVKEVRMSGGIAITTEFEPSSGLTFHLAYHPGTPAMARASSIPDDLYARVMDRRWGHLRIQDTEQADSPELTAFINGDHPGRIRDIHGRSVAFNPETARNCARIILAGGRPDAIDAFYLEIRGMKGDHPAYKLASSIGYARARQSWYDPETPLPDGGFQQHVVAHYAYALNWLNADKTQGRTAGQTSTGGTGAPVDSLQQSDAQIRRLAEPLLSDERPSSVSTTKEDALLPAEDRACFVSLDGGKSFIPAGQDIQVIVSGVGTDGGRPIEMRYTVGSNGVATDILRGGQLVARDIEPLDGTFARLMDDEDFLDAHPDAHQPE